MHDGSLSFIIPVRHQDSTEDWPTLKRHLAATLASVAAQTAPNWRCVVVANHGADLPTMPAKCEVVWVELPFERLLDPNVDLEGFRNGIRKDKGLRLLAGIQHLRPTGHVMQVDGDDWISPKLAELVSIHPAANGWYFDQAYVYAGGAILYKYPRDFFLFCGTSHIIRADLLLPQGVSEDEVDLQTVMTRLGSHVFIKRYLDEEDTPLSPLPFRGAGYRVGHGNSVTQSSALFDHLFRLPDALRHPRETLRRLGRLGLARKADFKLQW